jgi:N-acetylmuramoyl-L-alanine amidase
MFWVVLPLLLCGTEVCAQPARVVKVMVENAAIRSGPSQNYNRVMVLPAGIKLPVVKREDDWYRIALGDRQEAYVSSSVVQLLPEGTAPSQARVTDISTTGFEKGTRVTIYLSAPIAFRIIQRLRPAALVLELYNCRLAHYGVRQREGDDVVLAIETLQVTTNAAEVTFHLPQKQQAGYSAYFADSGNALIVDIRRSFAAGGLQGKLIGLDPGHGGHWSGAHGPTGLLEKDANLEIALRLKGMLEQAGANVFMTRTTDVGFGSRGDSQTADLHPRREMTRQAGCDIFVSIHNNHIGDGNPRTAEGTESFYWTPMSVALARSLQENVCAALGTKDRYVSWRPFYVLRDTDCPRALVECAYVSHPREEALLKKPEFRHQAAVGVFAGIREFLEKAVLTDGLEAAETPVAQ